MNHLSNLTSLKNKYFAMRHGQSHGNILNMVVGDPKIGVINYGLTELGKSQATIAAYSYFEKNDDLLIYSSDFLRARETAEIVRKTLDYDNVFLETALRERYFGKFEGRTGFDFEVVHANENHEFYQSTGVESYESVLNRVTGLVKRLEGKHTGKNILLVSHGDPIKMLQIGFMKKSWDYFRNVGYLHNAQLARLELSNGRKSE